MAPYTDCKIENDNSLWIFVTASNEARHLNDIVFGVNVLRQRNVHDSKILIFVNHPESALHLSPFGIVANVYSLQDIPLKLNAVDAVESAVVIVGGHGSSGGISSDSAFEMKPSQLLSSVRSIPGLKAGIIVLGQCFGGVFNFAETFNAPPLAIIGATNLNPSLSYSVKLSPPIVGIRDDAKLESWIANIFLFHLFEWLRSPKDVDGDGGLTLLDAYKFAGVESNRFLRFVKGQVLYDVERLKAEQSFLVGRKFSIKDLESILELHAIQTRIENAIEILYLHQEPWVLNANFARHVLF